MTKGFGVTEETERPRTGRIGNDEYHRGVVHDEVGFREVTPAIRRVRRECLEQRQTELGLGESKVSCHSVKKTGWKLRAILG